MYRYHLENLRKWKDKKDRLPLILRGARQTGKTWLLKEFGKTSFEDVVYINFENAGNLATIFDSSIEPRRIIDMLGAFYGRKIRAQNTLIIFDEIQEAPRALTSLKYFAENAPEYPICCAGSLLGIALHKGTSFPVGKITFLNLHPLNFEEFLLACGEKSLVDYIKQLDISTIPNALSDKLTDYLKQFFIIGGMPAAVSTWIENRDFLYVEEKQRDILDAYEQDFSKHAQTGVVPKIRYLWNSIPSQLAKENKKFIYDLIREGARAREYEDALLWLFDSGLIRKVGRVTKPAVPLKAYEDLKSFKIYHLDVGLLRLMGGLSPKAIISSAELFEEFKGALTEQYVLQELSSSESIKNIYYWTSERNAEVDFIFVFEENILPLEVKAAENLKAKSLKIYRGKYKPILALRTSLSNLRLDSGLLNVPLYAVFNTEDFIRKSLKQNN
ncbi:MAG: ATP-binding protein [Actinobacteria bacterium]|nr:ATP-binding protein [Actinomycetota bacterium]